MEPESSGAGVDSQGTNPRDRYFVRIVLLITAITYLGTVRFGFVHDVDPQIEANPFLKSWHYVPQYFTSSVWKQMVPLMPGNFYRPLFLLWMRLNYSIFSDHPFGWHIGAVLLHLLVTWLVYALVKRLTGQFTLAWLTALIFGVHPVHHEVVAWVSGTTESLAAAFFIAAFLAYLRSIEDEKNFWMALSCALYGLAMLSNETAVVLPVLVFGHSWLAGDSGTSEKTTAYGRRFAGTMAATSLYVPVGLIYLFVRYRALSGMSHPALNISIWMWVLTLPSMALFYVKSWLFPVHFSEYYDLYYQTRLNLAHVLLPALIVAALALMVWAFRRWIGPRFAGYAAVWLIVPLLPGLDTFAFRTGELVHDRYFYIPSIGAALLVGLIIDRILKRRPIAFGQPLQVIVAGLGLSIVLGFCTVRATSSWQDDYTLYSRAHQIAPLNLAATNELGAELITQRDIQSAETLLESDYQGNQGDSELTYNLGRVHYFKREYPEAEEYARQAIVLNPNSADAYVLLGQSKLKQNDIGAALGAFRRAVQLNPYNATFHTSYGIVLELNKDCTDAMPQFDAALALSPGDAFTQREMFRCRAALAVAPVSSTEGARH